MNKQNSSTKIIPSSRSKNTTHIIIVDLKKTVNIKTLLLIPNFWHIHIHSWLFFAIATSIFVESGTRKSWWMFLNYLINKLELKKNDQHQINFYYICRISTSNYIFFKISCKTNHGTKQCLDLILQNVLKLPSSQKVWIKISASGSWILHRRIQVLKVF